jgi:hypothetical protein
MKTVYQPDKNSFRLRRNFCQTDKQYRLKIQPRQRKSKAVCKILSESNLINLSTDTKFNKTLYRKSKIIAIFEKQKQIVFTKNRSLKNKFISVKNCLKGNYKFARFVRLDDFQRADKKLSKKHLSA